MPEPKTRAIRFVGSWEVGEVGNVVYSRKGKTLNYAKRASGSCWMPEPKARQSVADQSGSGSGSGNEYDLLDTILIAQNHSK